MMASAGPPGDRRPMSFLERKKNAAIPAIRTSVNLALTRKMALFSDFLQLSACFLCQ
jgi:hypothetical protein